MGELEPSSYIEQQRPAARGSALCIRPEAAVVEAAEERAVGRQCATATGRQLAVTALLLTPHRATQTELSAEPLVACPVRDSERSCTGVGRAPSCSATLQVPAKAPFPRVSSPCRLCRVHIFIITLYLLYFTVLHLLTYRTNLVPSSCAAPCFPPVRRPVHIIGHNPDTASSGPYVHVRR